MPHQYLLPRNEVCNLRDQLFTCLVEIENSFLIKAFPLINVFMKQSINQNNQWLSLDISHGRFLTHTHELQTDLHFPIYLKISVISSSLNL